MKKLLLAIGLSVFTLMAEAQSTMYFRGEWTKLNSADLFSGVFKINIDADGGVTGELLWTYLATDERDTFLVKHYAGKKGKRAIEFVEGNYNSSTHDMYFEGKNRTDPEEVIGVDKYSLKLSADKKVLYGRTATEGTNEGMFYAVQVDGRAVAQQLSAAKVKLKK